MIGGYDMNDFEEQEYGLLVEGDRDTLTFQGTRYLGFKRKRQTESL